MKRPSVSSLSEYVQIVCEYNSGLVRNGTDHHEVLLFRGQSDICYELIPSLGRNRKCPSDISIFNQERNLIEMAKYRLPSVFRNDLQPIELLALLQHHGIPTRLLDVTESALIALYFACCSNDDKDGEVIVFRNNDMDMTTYPIINAIADYYRLLKATSQTYYPILSFYNDAMQQTYFTEQKRYGDSRKGQIAENWIAQCCSIPLFVCTSINSIRQQMQRGRYILFPNKIIRHGSGNLCFDGIIEPIPKNHDAIIGCITIPNCRKNQFLTDLTLMGISKDMLFADSIDTVCESIVNACKYRISCDLSITNINE